jgi:hypothetical protein
MTAMKSRLLTLLGLATLCLGWQGSAEADFLFSFGSPSYTIGLGQTVQVQVFGTQNANTPQYGPGNAVTTAGITLSFPTGASAAIQSASNITGNSVAFDAISPPVLTSTQASLQEAVFFSPGLTSLPGLLATFTFTGLKQGLTQISVAAITPGPSFAAASGTFQPATTATATINVIPEPTSFLVILTGGPVLFGFMAVRFRRLSASQVARQ